MIQLNCPKCGKKLSVEDESSAGKARCPACNQEVPIPAGEQPASPGPVPLSVTPPGPTAAPPVPLLQVGGRGSSFPDRFLVGLILLVESSLLFFFAMDLFAVLGFEHTLMTIAPLLQGWMMIICVHAAGFALFRATGGGRAGLLGFAGLLLAYWGMEFYRNFMMGTMGPFDSYRSLTAIAATPTGFLLMVAGLARAGGRQGPAIAALAPPRGQDDSRLMNAGKFTALVVITLALAAISSVVGVILASTEWTKTDAWPHIAVYVYMGVSLLALAVALVSGLRACRERDPGKLWRAGVFATLGGLQHILLVGLPAMWAGVAAIRAANRASAKHRAPCTLFREIHSVWGLPNAMAFMVIVELFLFEMLNPDVLPAGVAVVIPLLAVIYAILSRRLLGSVAVAAVGQVVCLLGHHIGGWPWPAAKAKAIWIPVCVLGAVALAAIAALIARSVKPPKAGAVKP